MGVHQGNTKVRFLIFKENSNWPECACVLPVGVNKGKDKVNERWKHTLATKRVTKAAKRLIQ